MASQRSGLGGPNADSLNSAIQQGDTTPKERLNSKLNEDGMAPATFRSSVTDLVSSTDRLRKQRQSNRLQAADIMSSIQDTINPLNL